VKLLRRYGLMVRLDPSREQTAVFVRAAGARRFCFNACVAAIRENHERWMAEEAAGVPRSDRTRPLSAQDLEQRWRRCRPEWAGDVSSWVFSWACRDAAQAHRNFLAGRARFPLFARKGRNRERFTVAGRDITLVARSITLPKIGAVRIAGACPAQAELRRLLRRSRARVTSATVSRHADGTWWLAVKIERYVPHTLRHPNDGALVVGVDRGIKVAAVAATAQADVVAELGSGQRRRDAERRLARAQRQASRRYRKGRRREEQSGGWRSAQTRVGRLHAKVARQRADDLHRFTRALTDTSPVIVIETLATKNLMANHRLAGAIADQGWGELARQLSYKAQWAGGQVLPAPRKFPSSKACARCGRVKPKLALSVRTYTCDCGNVIDRDVNAAATLAAWGEHNSLGRCPCVTQARNPDPRGRSGTIRFHACGGWVSADPATRPIAVPSVEAGTSNEPNAA
jgi:putative transposase